MPKDERDHLNDFYLVGFSGPLRSNDIYTPIELLERVERGVLSTEYQTALLNMILRHHVVELNKLTDALRKKLDLPGPHIVGRF